MQTATEARRPFDLWTVDTNGEHIERIATGRAYTDEVHRVAWSEAVNTGDTVAIVWRDREGASVKGERFTATVMQKANVLQQRLFEGDGSGHASP